MPVHLPSALDAALRAQLEVRRGALAGGAAAVGWKIAASIPGVDDDAGLEGLVFGYLSSATVLPTGGRFRPGPTVELCAEVELGVLLGREVPPGADLDTAAAAIAGLGVALEIVDVDDRESMHEVVASNVFHRAVAFGPAREGAVADSLTAQLSVDGQVASTQAVQVEPAQTVVCMAQLLGAVERRVQAGEWIIGGSLIHLPIETNHEVTASLSGLDPVSLWIDP